MKHLQSFFLILFAGTTIGIFFFIRSAPALRLLEGNGTDSEILWAFSSLPTLLLFCLTANVALASVWWLSAFFLSKRSAEDFWHVLQRDAFTYLPLEFLLISLLQFNSLLTHYFAGILLLSHSAGYWLLLPALLGVYHLKIRLHGQLSPFSRRLTRRWFRSSPSWRLNAAIFLISLIIYTSVGIRLERKLGLGGDEPHYLLITHSLLHDRDLKIRNNYNQRDYQTFYHGNLDVHVSIAKDTTRYSIHPIGMPVLMIPAYAIAGHRGAILCMNVLGAMLALFLFLIAFSHTLNIRISLLVWAMVSFTPPLLLYAAQLYPETPSGLFLAAAYYLIRSQKHRSYPGSIALGLLLAYLPWLQQRMIVPSVLLLCYHLLSLWLAKRHPFWRKSHIVTAIIPTILLAVSGLMMAGQNYLFFRNPLPNASYKSVGIDEIFSWKIMLHEGLLGLLFDQEAGLLIYAPYFIFLFAGFLLLWRCEKLLTGFLLLTIASMYIPCAGFTLKWRGAWSPVARYMVTQIPLLIIPLGLGIQHIHNALHRYALVLTISVSAAWSVFFLQTPFLAIMRNQGINQLFNQASNLLTLPSYLPSFTPYSEGSFMLAGFWIATIALFSLSLYRSFPFSRGRRVRQRRDKRPDKQAAFFSVGLWYGVLILFSGLLTFFPLRPELLFRSEQAQNAHLRKFLTHIDSHAILRQTHSRKQPLAESDIRFSYMSRPRKGIVDPSQPERFILTGPRDPFLRGKYIVTFDMMVADTAVEEPVVTLDIVSHHGNRSYNFQTLKGTDFLRAGEFQQQSLSFELNKNVNDLETRVYFHNRTDVVVRKVHIQPKMSEFYYDDGLVALYTQNMSQAAMLFSRATIASNHSKASYQLGLLEQAAKRWEQSIAYFQNVIAADPAFADAYYRLGLAYQHLHDDEHALQAFKKAIEELPSHLDGWNALTTLYQAQGKDKMLDSVTQTFSKLYAPQYRYNVNFSDQILFLGFSIDTSVRGKLHIDYYWKALNDIASNYAIFVHFSGDGHKFQHDHFPTVRDATTGDYRTYPTNRWKIGELIREEFEIDAPAGTFQAELGIWEPEFTRKRLPIRSSVRTGWLRKRTTVTLDGIQVH
ncbi:hypothetical protein CSA56_09395 [candidate division KSB3 bacterium]|uniref:Uncharacterized protein n=1 Tax=candidate division KSB3 bacterium TaxID=2044937 RepID=A0A2G6KDZ0_9BACT|nr:MAG: hypothetical protein CSA56_09395 [candidate division KSB3 bacterium]